MIDFLLETQLHPWIFLVFTIFRLSQTTLLGKCHVTVALLACDGVTTRILEFPYELVFKGSPAGSPRWPPVCLFFISTLLLKDVRVKIFQNWFFSETFTTVRWWVSYVRNGENMPGRTPYIWKDRATFANMARVCEPKNISLKSLKWNVLCQLLFKWTC